MAMGVFGLGVVFAPAIGPTLGGLMIEYFSWRYVFFVSLPFCLIAAVMGALFMPTRPFPREIPRFDWIGFALLCIGLFGLMTGIANGPREGWESDSIALRLASGAAAAVGSLAAPRLAELLPERRLVAGLLVGSSLTVAALAAAPGVWSYGILRFVQVLCIAPVFPIVVARIAHTHGGEAIGVINAARIGASFLGPVVATSLLAAGSPVLLYAVLAAAGLACLPVSAMRAHVPAVPR
jgi:MFS family permease